jgi:hypothetical protein
LYVFLVATHSQTRVNRRKVSQVAVIATGVTADGLREVLGSPCATARAAARGPRSYAQSPEVETILRDSEDDLLAFATFSSAIGRRSREITRWNG